MKGDFGRTPSSTTGGCDKNAQRDVQTMLEKAGYSLTVDKSMISFTAEDGSVIELPLVKPTSWLSTLLSNYSFLLQGGDGKDLHQQLAAFWECYKFVQPGHEVYKLDPGKLAYTLPLLLYGDEGRYLKKGNFMVCTIECALGSSPKKPKPCNCSSDPVLQRYGAMNCGSHGVAIDQAAALASTQQVNDSGNEFLSKFLLFGIASQVYRKNKGLITMAFDEVVSDLSELFWHGIVVSGSTYFGAVLGCKGDLKFHHQLGNLQRSYYNVGVKKNHPICSLCLAGKEGIEFEDLSDHPKWLATEFQKPPWEENMVPSLAKLPFETGKAEGIFRLDLFHCWKCGLGRDLIGSATVVLCLLGYFDFPGFSENFPDRLERAWSSFRLWTLANQKTPAIHYFSKSLFNTPNQRSFAWANVKGSDTTLMTQWVLHVVRLSRESRGPVNDALEGALIEACESAIALFAVLHSHPLWMDRVCGQRCQHHLLVMIRAYRFLAMESRRLGVVGFGLKPKMHALHHISKSLKSQLQSNAPRILNPLVFSCEANESVVGHVSRIARRVSSRTVSLRVLERVLIRTKALIRKRKGNLSSRLRAYCRRARRMNA